jgi:hypothetical protein
MDIRDQTKNDLTRVRKQGSSDGDAIPFIEKRLKQKIETTAA